jgi:hypothetical protein
MHAPAESSRAGHRQNTSARTRERAGSIPLGPSGPVTPPSLPPTATPFACRQNCLCCSSAPLCALLRHARPLFATPPDAGPALRSNLVVSQVPPRPPSLNYRRARPRCPLCGSSLSCRSSVSSAHARAARVPWSASRLACTARVPRLPTPQPLPQLLPRARACALQPRTAAPLPRCYRTRGPGLAALALVHVPVQLLHLLTPPAWRPFTPLGPRPAPPAPAHAAAPPRPSHSRARRQPRLQRPPRGLRPPACRAAGAASRPSPRRAPPLAPQPQPPVPARSRAALAPPSRSGPPASRHHRAELRPPQPRQLPRAAALRRSSLARSRR